MERGKGESTFNPLILKIINRMKSAVDDCNYSSLK